jgi:uncharacterized YccA/Bax inhibitor family protein
MTELTGRLHVAVPWHLWLVGALALLWNGYGAYDYLMTNLQGDAYLAGMGMTAAQMDYYTAMPAWMTAAWALGVWGGTIGAILLLLRMKWATWIHTFTSNGLEVAGTAGVVMSVVITLVCVFLILYARMMTARRVLR